MSAAPVLPGYPSAPLVADDDRYDAPQHAAGQRFLDGRPAVLHDEALVVLADCVAALGQLDELAGTARHHAVWVVERLMEWYGIKPNSRPRLVVVHRGGKGT